VICARHTASVLALKLELGALIEASNFEEFVTVSACDLAQRLGKLALVNKDGSKPYLANEVRTTHGKQSG
jgi:hypothetical protein